MEPQRGGCSQGIRTVSFSYGQTLHRCAHCPSNAARAERTQMTHCIGCRASVISPALYAGFLCHMIAAAGGSSLLSVPLQAPGEGR